MTNTSQLHKAPSFGVIVCLQDLGFASDHRLITETESTLLSLGIRCDSASDDTAPASVSFSLCAREQHQSALESLKGIHSDAATFAAMSLQEALKQALQACNADYVLICSNGDQYPHSFLSTVQQKLLAAPAPLDLIKGVVVDDAGTPLWPTTDATASEQAPVTLLTSISTCVFRRDYLLAHGLEDVLTEWFLLYAARDPQIKMVFCPELKVEVNKHTFEATGAQRFHLLGATLLRLNSELQKTSVSAEQRLYLLATVFADVYLQLEHLPYVKDRLMYGEHIGKAYSALSAQLNGSDTQDHTTATQNTATQCAAAQLFLTQLRTINPTAAQAAASGDPYDLFPALSQQEQVQLQIRANEDECKIAHLQTTLEKLGELLARQTRGETATDQKFYVIAAMSNMPVFQDMWRDYFLNNPFLRERPNIKMVQWLTEVNADGNIDQGRAQNEFIASCDLSEDAWLFFVHADYEILDDLGQVFAPLDRNCLYGPHGVVKAKYRDKYYSIYLNSHVQENRHDNGFNPGHTNLDLAGDNDRVECLDSIIAIHTSLLRRYPKLRFDDKLTIHLAIEDISINGLLNYGIESRQLFINANHHGEHIFTTLLQPEFVRFRDYLTEKYPDHYFPVVMGNFVGHLDTLKITETNGATLEVEAADYGQHIYNHYQRSDFIWSQQFIDYRRNHVTATLAAKLKEGVDDISGALVDRMEDLYDLLPMQSHVLIQKDATLPEEEQQRCKLWLQKSTNNTQPELIYQYGLCESDPLVLTYINGKDLIVCNTNNNCDTTLLFPEMFPQSQVYAIEADTANFKHVPERTLSVSQSVSQSGASPMYLSRVRSPPTLL